MKRILVIVVFSAVFLPIFGRSGNTRTTISLVQNKTVRSLSFKINSDSSRLSFALAQDKNGKPEIKVPAFIFHTKHNFTIGQLRFGGYSGFAMNPMQKSIFNLSRQNELVESVSSSPQYWGISKKFKNVTLAVINPILSASSPLGAMVIAQNNNIFCSVLRFSTNNMKKSSYLNQYQVNWKQSDVFDYRYYVLLGEKYEVSTDFFTFKTAVFSDTIFDSNSEVWGYYGWDLGLESKRYEVLLFQRFNSLSASDVVERFLSFDFSIHHDVDLNALYTRKYFPMSIYNDIRKIEHNYRLDVKYRKFKFTAKHSAEEVEDMLFGNKKQTVASVFSLSADKLAVKNSSFSIRTEVGFSSDTESGLSMDNFSVKLQDSYAKLEFTNKAVKLALSFATYIQKVRVKISLNQDRLFSISASL